MPQTLDSLARELRAGVLGSDHEKAMRLTVEYAEALRRHWMPLSAEERVRSPIPKQSRELLAWVRDMTLMQQAMAAEQLALVEGAKRRLTARAVYLQAAGLDARR
jgi:hypothetical protein